MNTKPLYSMTFRTLFAAAVVTACLDVASASEPEKPVQNSVDRRTNINCPDPALQHILNREADDKIVRESQERARQKKLQEEADKKAATDKWYNDFQAGRDADRKAQLDRVAKDNQQTQERIKEFRLKQRQLEDDAAAKAKAQQEARGRASAQQQEANKRFQEQLRRAFGPSR